MITVNDKIKLFTKRIVNTKQNEYDEKVKALEADMLKDLEMRKEALVKERDKYETSLLKSINSEKNQRLSNARSERKRRLLLKKKEMIDSLLEGVKAYTIAFSTTEGYEKYLKKILMHNMSSIKLLNEFFVYLKAEDFIKYKIFITDILREATIGVDNFEIRPYEGKMIGGVIIIKKDRTTRLDMSLDSVIEDNREYMGQLIYGMLEEAGETNGK